MTEAAPKQTVYGRSYWDIVVSKFRKNRTATAAVWIIGVMVLVAIFAPLMANDRPFAFYGTVPELYDRSYKEWVGPAHTALMTAPGKYAEDRDTLADDGRATLLRMLEFLEESDRREFEEEFLNEDADAKERDALAVRINKNHPLRGPLLSRQITAKEIRPVLKPEEVPRFEEWLAMSRRRMESVYHERVAQNREGVRQKADELAGQLPPDKGAAARALAERYLALTEGDYLNSEADKQAFRELRKELAETLARDKVTLVPTWRYPLPQSLGMLDVFFMIGGIVWLMVFGPLYWLRFKRVQPRARRWLVQWTCVLVPAIVFTVGWLIVHEEQMERINYKTWTADGRLAIEKAYWPPHRYHQDELIEGEEHKEEEPSWMHPLGKDHIGRDLLARILWGARISLSVGFVSTAIALTIGVLLGALSGYVGGWTDWAISRVIEIFICFPYFFIILAVAAFLPAENRIFYIMLAIGFFQWMTIARLTRGEFLKLRQQEFVTAARALGAGGARTIFRHILPNAMAPVLIAVSFGIAGAILAESGLSFLGFGVQEPDVSWGKVLNAARTQPKTWWPLVYPGLCIFLSITCYNLIGDAIRDAVDPRLKVE